jgi:chitodextrinase
MNEHESPLPETVSNVPPATIVARAETETSIATIWGYMGGQTSETRLKWLIEETIIGQVDLPNGAVRYRIDGLRPDTLYRIRAHGLKENEESAASRSTQESTLPATSKPGSPTNLIARPARNSMALTWTGVANASSYKIDYGIEPNGPTTRIISFDPACSIAGLISDTRYFFDVSSSNSNGDSAPTRIVEQTLHVPAPPADLRATPAITTMDLTWSPSDGAVEYYLRHGVEPGGAPVTLVTRLTTHRLTGLIKNTLYFVKVSAANSNGESLPARITQKTQDGPPLPSNPWPLQVFVSFDTVRVAWGAPQQDGYEITYGLEDSYPECLGRQTTEYLTDVIRYLAPDTRYFIEVRAFNASGYSPPSRTSATIGPDRTQPRDLRNPGRTFSEARLAWTAPEDASYLTGYKITCPGREPVQTTALEHIFTGLVPETEYLFKVQPIRREGPSPALSASISVVTHDHVPPARPRGLKFTHTAPGNAVLSWHASEDNVGVTGYEVRRNEEGWVLINDTCYPISGLLDDVVETFWVRAKDAANNDSRPGSVRTPKLFAPSQPGMPELRDLSHASVTLYWTPSTHEWGAIRYRVYLNEVLVMLVNEPVATLVHLQSHTDYRVDVRAFNAAGASEPAVIRFKTRVRAPTQLRFSQRNGLCRLGWDPVFKKYPVHEISINGQVFNTAPGHWGYSFKLADVSSGPVPHHLKFAVHARLDGDISDIAMLEITVADDVPPSQPETPVVSDITDNGVTLSWIPSSDSVGVTGYEVVLNGLLVFQTPDTHFTFTQLTSGAYHWVFVRARDKEGNVSAGSRPVTFKTTGQAPSPRPSAPQASITALTSTSARLGWEYEDDIPVSGVRILINEEHFRDVLLLNGIVLNNLIPNTEYSISVSMFDVYGQLSEPTMLTFEPRDVTPPSLPGHLGIVEVTADSVTLSWESSTDDIGIHEYVIYNNHEYFDSTPLTHYTAVDLLPGTYSFEVCAMDLSGNASEPATAAVNIQGSQSSGPTHFRFTQTGLIPTLEWDAPDDIDGAIRYYIVLIGPQGTVLPYQASQTSLRPVLLPRSRYRVSITAIHAAGHSQPLIDEFTTN